MHDKASQSTRVPVWVKISGVIACIFALVFAALHLTGRGVGGPHGGHVHAPSLGGDDP
jgi:hypothetical protein